MVQAGLFELELPDLHAVLFSFALSVEQLLDVLRLTLPVSGVHGSLLSDATFLLFVDGLNAVFQLLAAHLILLALLLVLLEDGLRQFCLAEHVLVENLLFALLYAVVDDSSLVADPLLLQAVVERLLLQVGLALSPLLGLALARLVDDPLVALGFLDLATDQFFFIF